MKQLLVVALVLASLPAVAEDHIRLGQPFNVVIHPQGEEFSQMQSIILKIAMPGMRENDKPAYRPVESVLQAPAGEFVYIFSPVFTGCDSCPTYGRARVNIAQGQIPYKIKPYTDVEAWGDDAGDCAVTLMLEVRRAIGEFESSWARGECEFKDFWSRD